MVVVVNALPLRAGGGLTVGLNVVAHLPKVAPGWRFYVLASRGVGYEELQSTNVSVRVVDWPALGPLGQLRYLNLDIPRLSRSVKANVLFTMGNMATVNTTLPQLLLFHKAHFVYPELWPVLFPSAAARRRFLLERAYFRMGLKRSRVVAQTDVMRARLIAQYGLDQNRVEVVPNAVDQARPSSRPGVQAATMAAVPTPYKCFYLTRYYDHKNLEILPEVSERLRELGLEDTVFVTTLSERDFGRALDGRVPGAGETAARQGLVNIGEVPMDQVGHCFQQSWALVMPTLLESFSGTYIEAMRYGCPILTSDRDFARAVCGDAALYFEPTDPADIAEKILRLRSEPGLREKLIENGRRRLKLISPGWAEITERYVGLLHEIATSG